MKIRIHLHLAYGQGFRALRHQGFSLIEVTLALAVFALAIVALLSLLPNAFGTAQRSRAETRATQISRSVFSDLRATPFANARVSCPDSTSNPPQGHLSIDLGQSHAGANAIDIAYNSNGEPTGKLGGSSGDYASGAKGGAYLIRLEATPEASPPAGTPARYSTVLLSVEFPGPAKAANRTQLKFATIVSR